MPAMGPGSRPVCMLETPGEFFLCNSLVQESSVLARDFVV